MMRDSKGQYESIAGRMMYVEDGYGSGVGTQPSTRTVLTHSLARPPGGRRDRTGQLSIWCPKAPQGRSHVGH